MFPDFRYLIYWSTGHFPPQWVGLFKVFGLMVALAFLAASLVMVSELKRKERQGLLEPTYDAKRKMNIWPHQRISEIVMVAAIGGIIGAKVFNAFESWNDFIHDPIGNLFSRSGFTFYGGLIVATAVFYFYARKYKIRFAYLADCAAPAVMIAYGIGRLGCQLAGDGDWGIYNSAYVTQTDASTVAHVTDLRLNRMQTKDSGEIFMQKYAALLHTDEMKQGTPHFYAPAPSWAPRWLYAQNFPMNVTHQGIVLQGAPSQEYATVLPVAVFPTSLYEALAGILLFLFLWSIRRRLKRPWEMFGIYLIVNGLERFLIEQIRVNYKYDWGWLHPTQAEIIAVCLMVGGILLLLTRKRKALPPPELS